MRRWEDIPSIQSCEVAKSAQHQVWIIHLGDTEISMKKDNDEDAMVVPFTTDPIVPSAKTDPGWTDGLLRGNHRLVVRVWKGKCRWWNLHHHASDDDDLLARQELWGYQTAKQVFDDNHRANSSCSSIRIPAILYDGTSSSKVGEHGVTFAIMEYVGKESTMFCPNPQQQQQQQQHGLLLLSMDTYWTDGMITIRDEFGFPEPHPRWGRVPVDQALEYAMQVLVEVILPLHAYCRSHRMHIAIPLSGVYTFQDMVTLHQQALKTVIVPFLNQNKSNNIHWQGTVDRLQSALQTLQVGDTNYTPENDISPVLVHMDLQPQNIIFGRHVVPDQNHQNHPFPRRNRIVSVLDWEEAAWADPRFELLMLGRKVCANQQQAYVIWGYYQEQTGLELGSFEIWLRMESIHCLITLLLQAVTGTGRNPWEDTSDLGGKMDREMARWNVYERQLLRR